MAPRPGDAAAARRRRAPRRGSRELGLRAGRAAADAKPWRLPVDAVALAGRRRRRRGHQRQCASPCARRARCSAVRHALLRGRRRDGRSGARGRLCRCRRRCRRCRAVWPRRSSQPASAGTPIALSLRPRPAGRLSKRVLPTAGIEVLPIETYDTLAARPSPDEADRARLGDAAGRRRAALFGQGGGRACRPCRDRR